MYEPVAKHPSRLTHLRRVSQHLGIIHVKGREERTDITEFRNVRLAQTGSIEYSRTGRVAFFKCPV